MGRFGGSVIDSKAEVSNPFRYLGYRMFIRIYTVGEGLGEQCDCNFFWEDAGLRSAFSRDFPLPAVLPARQEARFPKKRRSTQCRVGP